MRVRVLYFGVLKDLLRRECEERDVAEASSVGELVALLRQGNPSSVWTTLAVAVNREYASRAAVLREGDEVALLPPVSGGSHER